FPCIAGHAAGGTRATVGDLPAANPGASPCQNPGIRAAWPERTRIAPARHGVALVFAAAVAGIADEPRRAIGAGAGRFARPCPNPPRTMEDSPAAVAAGIPR